jgi:mRNA-degrading endonuclease RelE of RelBE toxin-antitoxin system
MQIFFTKSFKKDYKKLPANIQKAVEKQLGWLLENPEHPSLKLKKMQDPRGIWEVRITRGYCFTFQIEEDEYIMRRLKTHDILRNA